MNFTILKYKLIILFLLLYSALFASKKEMIIVIDPGHGGKDVGAISTSIKEKDVALNIGLKLGKYINEFLPDVKVLYTRNNDTFVPLHQRAAIANKSKADLFISLHANFCGIPSITGTETFILGLHKSQDNLDVAKKENSVILFEDDHTERYEGFDPNLSESYIMFELIQDEFLDQSASFADLVQNQFKGRAERKDRGVKQAGFLVLRQTGMPSVLIETGFLSNQNEAKYLESKNGQDYIASAIFRAFRDYKKIIDSKSEFNIAESLPVEITSEEKSQDKSEKALKPVSDDVYFSLQLVATQKNLNTNSVNFKGLDNVRKIQSGKLNKYFWGKETNPKKIQELKLKVKKQFPDSFMVAFKNDQQISVHEALKLIQ